MFLGNGVVVLIVKMTAVCHFHTHKRMPHYSGFGAVPTAEIAMGASLTMQEVGRI